MSMYLRFDAEHLPSLITTNTHHRHPIFTSAAPCELLLRTIYNARSELSFHLLAFTIMPDHLHLILVPAPDGLSRAMQVIKGRFARAYNRHVGGTGAVWQSRYHERTLRNEEALFRAIEYVHQNPVAAHLSSEPQAYRWSSAGGRHPTDVEAYFGQAKA